MKSGAPFKPAPGKATENQNKATEQGLCGVQVKGKQRNDECIERIIQLKQTKTTDQKCKQTSECMGRIAGGLEIKLQEKYERDGKRGRNVE